MYVYMYKNVGMTSIMWAAYSGSVACMDLLAKSGADINAKDNIGQWISYIYIHIHIHTYIYIYIYEYRTVNFNDDINECASNLFSLLFSVVYV